MKKSAIVLALLSTSLLSSNVLAAEQTAIEKINANRNQWYTTLDEKVIGAYPAPASLAAEQDRLASILYTSITGERKDLALADRSETTAYLLSTFSKSALGDYAADRSLAANLYYKNAYSYIYNATYALDTNAARIRSLDFILKDKYLRGRPYQVLDADGNYNENYWQITGSSYPSGHTWKGYRQAIALSLLFPERGDELFSRALQFGESRVIVNAHFPTDTIASRIGTYYTLSNLLADDDITAEIVENAKALRQSMDPLCELDMRQCLEQQARPVYDSHAADNFSIGYYGSRQSNDNSYFDPQKFNMQTGYLLRLRFPYLNPEDWRDILASTAYPEDSLAGWSIEQGNDMSYWGLINLPAAYNGPAHLYRDMTINQNINTANDISGFGAFDIWKNNIDGDGHLTKNGDGTLVLSGQNSFGGFTLNGGQLILNGQNNLTTQSNINGGELAVLGQLSSDLLVNNSGILSGTGSTGNVVMNNGAILRPGTTNNAGTLVINGNLTLNDGVHLNYRFGEVNIAGGTNNDLVSVNGDLTLAGTINVTENGNFAPGIYRIFNYSGSLSDNGLLIGTMPQQSQTHVQTAVKGEVNLVNSYGTQLNFWDGEGIVNDSVITGGSGIWQMAPNGATPWTSANGAQNGSFEKDAFAVFTGKAGQVAINANNGPVSASGLQFASDGYRLSGDMLQLSGNQNIIRVSDGTANIDNDLQGEGQLQKLDGGRLILNGNNIFNTGTQINGGSLIVNGSLLGDITINAGTTLGGTGQTGNIYVAQGAILAPGQSIGTLYVQNVTFATGSHYNVEVDNMGNSDLLAASGGITINGGNLNIFAGNGFYRANTNYTIMTAQNGITKNGVNGFDAIASNLAFLTPNLVFNDNSLVLQMARNDIALCFAGATSNQCSTAKAIETLDLQTPVYEAVLNLSRDNANPAFDQLSGEIFGSARSALLQNSHHLRDQINQRMLSDSAMPTTEPLWFATWGHGGKLPSTNNAGKINNDGWGIALGLDGALTDKAFAGIVFGYERSEIDGRYSSRFNVDALHLGAYVASEISGIKLRGGIAYSHLDNETERKISIHGLESTANASFNGWQMQIFGEASHDFHLNEGAVISPYANIAHIWLNLEDISESASYASLFSDSNTTNTSFTTLGLRGNFKLGKHVPISLYGDIGWSHAFGDIDGRVENRFALGSHKFSVEGTPIAKNSALIGAGFTWQVTPHNQITLGYRGQVASDIKDHGAHASWKITF
ncbi:autotransporter domain-containing protein [Bartonella sp. HY329]|uniref:autotransporter domain-containing protein n=1 Tax=unclassified Bartonella TaxID=2645622 RepID=UPI0021C75708|nr:MULTISPECIES: autotransporter domain-containing protein [unclassified Bartonella]UXM95533.1 autotransporter domain-containing protein [Bartonella sp. HY329]UXN09858.1 autotransporter domain-containing protein [Bartonella sp. HY328]